jgi:hypothetical protein
MIVRVFLEIFNAVTIAHMVSSSAPYLRKDGLVCLRHLALGHAAVHHFQHERPFTLRCFWSILLESCKCEGKSVSGCQVLCLSYLSRLLHLEPSLSIVVVCQHRTLFIFPLSNCFFLFCEPSMYELHLGIFAWSHASLSYYQLSPTSVYLYSGLRETCPHTAYPTET